MNCKRKTRCVRHCYADQMPIPELGIPADLFCLNRGNEKLPTWIEWFSFPADLCHPVLSLFSFLLLERYIISCLATMVLKNKCKVFTASLSLYVSLCLFVSLHLSVLSISFCLSVSPSYPGCEFSIILFILILPTSFSWSQTWIIALCLSLFLPTRITLSFIGHSQSHQSTVSKMKISLLHLQFYLPIPQLLQDKDQASLLLSWSFQALLLAPDSVEFPHSLWFHKPSLHCVSLECGQWLPT